MTLEQIYHVVTVAEFLNFSRAAAKLHISQPALSLSIKRAEEELELALFARSTQSVRLTDAGAAFCRYAAPIIDSFESLMREMGRLRALEAGVRIGLIPTAKPMGLLGDVLAFVGMYPESNASILSAPARELLNKLQRRELDVAILPILPDLTVPIALPLSLRYLFSDRYCALMSPENRLCAKKVLTREDLRDEPFVVYENDIVSEQEERAFARHLGVQPHIALKTRDLDVAFTFVAQNIGIRFGPQRIAGYYGLEAREVADVSQDYQYFLACPSAVENSVPISRLRELLMQRYRPDPVEAAAIEARLSHWRK